MKISPMVTALFFYEVQSTNLFKMIFRTLIIAYDALDQPFLTTPLGHICLSYYVGLSKIKLSCVLGFLLISFTNESNITYDDVHAYICIIPTDIIII